MINASVTKELDDFEAITNRLGNTWTYNRELGNYELPEYSLGPALIQWVMTYLLSPMPRPDGIKCFMLTPEQARFICWLYAVDANGRWLYPKEVYLQRAKGWGKDPLAAVILLLELCAPVVFDRWAIDKERGVKYPVGRPHYQPLVQMMSVKASQNENTQSVFPKIISNKLRRDYNLEDHTVSIKLKTGGRIVWASSQNGASIQGNSPVFILFNEIQHFINPGERESFNTASGNATKVGGRILCIFNAPSPNEESVAQIKRTAYEEMKAGRAYDTDMYWDSLEVKPNVSLDTPEEIETALIAAYGDSWFANIEGNKNDFLNISVPLSYSKRFFLNCASVREEAWIDIRNWDECARPDIKVGRKDPIIVSFDGSKNNDCTVIIGTRISDGFVFKLGFWAAPPKINRQNGEVWNAPRDEVDERMRWIHKNFTVYGLFCDPSHAKTDSSVDGTNGVVELYWDNLIDSWHREFNKGYKVWANKSKAQSTMFDMSNSINQSEFVDELMKYEQKIFDMDVIHDGDPDIRRHMANAMIAERRDGRHSIWKGDPNSPKKIDLAVTIVIGRVALNRYLNRHVKKSNPLNNIYR